MDSLLREELPTIVSNGAFGKNLKYLSFDLDKDHVGQDQYMSTVLFGTVTTSDESQHRVVIKLKLRDEKLRVMFKIDFQFHNEIIMYEKIIPFLFECYRSMTGVGDCPTLARFFYGRNICGEFVEKDLIMLENVIPLGFRLSEDRLFIDYNHLVIALQALAKFHGLSYTAKHKDRGHLRKIVTDIRETQFDVNGQWSFKNKALSRCSKRGVDQLLERSGDLYRDNDHLRRFNELVRDGENSLRRALVPREPFSVVCHGDFNRNNVLFQYDEAGLPVDVLLFDFGTPRYGSPALDLSFFLYMNTVQNLRESRWDDLLNAYCLTLREFVPPGIRVPNRAELDSEMSKCALYGFAHASFFLPYQLRETDLEEEMDDEETLEWLLQLGGDIGSDLVADMVQHIVDMKYTNV
ncbi:uncharacterized protein LOC100167634 [Acyrthosiphon pisum]|uniref:CHK kinase-like domain-containing protein n=1 Tax=Acyrthosiphon pisum TaxID=7029 RepID=A0A8R2D3P9_ACYPI|nr:uncharacterized protein LOC100167634 [Acyrthosiphon pisum]XP_016659184.1 uncharacterized protein LOC100167634 [Acyrthosiphon pisum]XP_029344252.1 uncharacterized protein LOC100167634 [Acyrthosiphon pisum]XP_029344253.1 uncharacterized protein LOC100167634 [Acyrthosiphon pisum]|eukprot:XP_016659182.1 PREDICTED: uncharacterized protein LOC100167634 [Acyrthosiphon pisum]